MNGHLATFHARLVTILVLAILLSLATGLIYSDRQLRRARRAEALADQRLFETKAALNEAEDARVDAETVTQFLTDTFAAADPSEQGKDVTVREVLDHASVKISQQFAGKPLIEARLRKTIGWTYHGLGLYDQAEENLADAAATYQRMLGEHDPRTLAATNTLAVTLGLRGKYSASESSLRSILETRRRALGEEHPDTLASMINLTAALIRQRHYTEAEELARKTLEIHRRTLGEEHPNTLMSVNNLAEALSGQGRYSEAEELQRKALKAMRRSRDLGEKHPYTLASMNNLAAVLNEQKRYTEAEEIAQQALTIWDQKEESIDAYRWLTTSVRGGALTGLGRFAEAEPLLISAYEGTKDRTDLSPAAKREVLDRIIHLYESWEGTDPQKGHLEKGVEWRAKLEILSQHERDLSTTP